MFKKERKKHFTAFDAKSQNTTQYESRCYARAAYTFSFQNKMSSFCFGIAEQSSHNIHTE